VLVLLVVEDVGVCLGAVAALLAIFAGLTAHRASVVSVFLAVPNAALRALANKSTAIDEDEDDSDDGELWRASWSAMANALTSKCVWRFSLSGQPSHLGPPISHDNWQHHPFPSQQRMCVQRRLRWSCGRKSTTKPMQRRKRNRLEQSTTAMAPAPRAERAACGAASALLARGALMPEPQDWPAW
jgi:hypothetical protein